MWPGLSLAVALLTASGASGDSHSPLGITPRLYSLQDHSTTDGIGILPLTLSNDMQSYYAVIAAGNISFRVALDTASSDLWITSSACVTKACKPLPKYPLTYRSPSFIPVNENSTAFNVRYTDGTAASGFVARETVQLSNLIVAEQVFGVVNDSSVTMTDQISGIFGLGFPRLSSISGVVANATPFFATLAQRGTLGYPLFGLSLTRNTSGTLSIGAVDASVVANVSAISWHDVIPFSPFASENNVSSYLQWTIALSGFSVNGTGFNPIPSYPTATRNISLALLDIGTAGLFGPYQDVSRLFSVISGSRLVNPDGQWAVPCDAAEKLSFTFGSQNFTLQPSDYLIGPALGNPNLCLAWPRAVPPSSDGIDWQMGSAFLRTVYSIFSFGINAKETPMVGLYALHNSTEPIESPASIASFFSSVSATIATTLPNFPLPSPSLTTPPYAFNTSVPASIGQIISSGLATSTYLPVFGTPQFNASALPTVSPVPSVVTFIMTDTQGIVFTSTSTVVQPSVTLGQPPGWKQNADVRPYTSVQAIALSTGLALLLFANLIS